MYAIKSIFACSRPKVLQLSRVQVANNVLPLSSLRLYASDKPTEPKEALINVYHGPMAPQIRNVKIFSFMTTIAGVTVQPIFLDKVMTMGFNPLLIGAWTFIGFFTFVTPFLLHFVAKKYVTDLYYNEKSEEYTAETYNFFLRKKRVSSWSNLY
jgi:transmembrane protein 70